MAKANHEKIMLVLETLILLSVDGAAGRKNLTDSEIRRELKLINKPAIKTIKVVPLVLAF